MLCTMISIYTNRYLYTLVSHKQRNNGYFVYPTCYSKSTDITFKSPHIFHFILMNQVE